VKHLVVIVIISLGFALFITTYTAEGILNTAYSHKHFTISYDNTSVPVVDYGYKGDIYIGPQRSPVTIAQNALGLYDKYNRTHSEEFLQKFLNNSNWLVDNAASKGNYSLLEFQFFWPTYNVESPWRSGMAQGRALEVLIKAHEITGDKKYLDTAKMLLNAFFVEVKDGGVTRKTPNDGWWYEEYASSSNATEESRVLNGMGFALLGIQDYYQYTGDSAAKFLFDQGATSVAKSLPRYEYVDDEYTGEGYSSYDILNNTKPAPLKYHKIHVTQLGELYEITGEEIFKTYHDKWNNPKLPEFIEKIEEQKIEEIEEQKIEEQRSNAMQVK
jgi:heparosan-N-sulfate-glucuronate 5-epimerase